MFKTENWDYYLGNTFDYWTGPKPPASHLKYSHVMNQLGKIYQTYNLTKEIITYYHDALIGQPFNWYLSNDGEKNDGEMSAEEELLQKWWDWQYKLNFISNINRINPLSDAIISMLINEVGNNGIDNSGKFNNRSDGIGVGYLRLYSPKRLQQRADEYQRYVIHSPSPHSVSVIRDLDGFINYAIYSGVQGSETYKLLDSGLCEITDYDGNISTIDLDGHLPIFEFKGEVILTNAIKQGQNSINKTLTLKGENLSYAGFLERVILNGQMPGEWLPDAGSPTGERFVPNESLTYGANTVNFIQGLPIGDPRNPEGYTNPSISYREPTNSDAFKTSLEIDIQVMYMASGLGHLLTTSDGSLSGVSRESIKTAFETRLKGYQRTIETTLSSLFCVVSNLMGINQYEPVIQLNLALGKPLPDYSKIIIEQYNTGLISKNTAMVGIGVKDPDAELELIKREEEEDTQSQPDTTDFVSQYKNDAGTEQNG